MAGQNHSGFGNGVALWVYNYITIGSITMVFNIIIIMGLNIKNTIIILML